MYFTEPVTLTIEPTTKASLIARLTGAGVQLNAYARELFEEERFVPRDVRYTITLVQRTVASLGFEHGAIYEEVVAAAAERGLSECPLEVAAHLRLAWLEQPSGPYLTIASEKPRVGDMFPNGFYLRRREDGIWLRGYRASPDWVCPPEFLLMFAM